MTLRDLDICRASFLGKTDRQFYSNQTTPYSYTESYVMIDTIAFASLNVRALVIQ